MKNLIAGSLLLLTSASVCFAQESFSVVVDRGGPGTGIVFSSPAAILCGPNLSPCSRTFPASTTVTLTAAAAEGSTFASWSGCDTVSGVDCRVRVSRSKLVKANFSFEKKRYKLRVTLPPGGVGGEAVSAPEGLLCVNRICEGVFDADTEVRMRAWSIEYGFSNRSDWFGCDYVKYNYCYVIMSDHKSLSVFNWQ